MTIRKLIVPVLLSAAAAACRPSGGIDYATADPVADARRAALDSGRIQLFALVVGDSQFVPWDTTGTREKTYNLNAPIVLLKADPQSERRGQPSEAQLRYVTRYNTTVLALVDTNVMRLPRN